MARTYRRDARGRFSSGGGGGKGGKPKAKAAPTRAGNRLTRDNAGRITSIGKNGATARGGRLKTAAGNKRATQTARIKGPAKVGQIVKPKPAPAPAEVKAKPKAQPNPQNKGLKGKKRWLSNEQVMQANEARGKDVRFTAEVFSTKLPKATRDASGVSTVGAFVAKYAGKPLSFAQANLVKDKIEKVTGIGNSRLRGVGETINNANKTVTFRLTAIASRQAAIAEKRASRKPRRRRR